MTPNHIGDGMSIGIVIGTIAGWLPPLAALASLIWISIQIYEWWQKKKNGTKTN